MNDASRRRGVCRDGITYQIVHQQNGGRCDGFDGFERQQFRVARTSADERDMGLRCVCHVYRLIRASAHQQFAFGIFDAVTESYPAIVSQA
jgi:hypothetical protein